MFSKILKIYIVYSTNIFMNILIQNKCYGTCGIKHHDFFTLKISRSFYQLQNNK